MKPEGRRVHGRRGQRGEPRERVGLGELRPPDGVPHEAPERPGLEVRRAGDGRPLVLDDPQPEDPGPGLDEVLDPAAPDVDAELPAFDDRDLDLVGSEGLPPGHELFGELFHLRPPTVIREIFIVGQPSFTGTSWPSLLQVPVGSPKARSEPTQTSLFRMSMFVPMSVA